MSADLKAFSLRDGDLGLSDIAQLPSLKNQFGVRACVLDYSCGDTGISRFFFVNVLANFHTRSRLKDVLFKSTNSNSNSDLGLIWDVASFI